MLSRVFDGIFFFMRIFLGKNSETTSRFPEDGEIKKKAKGSGYRLMQDVLLRISFDVS